MTLQYFDVTGRCEVVGMLERADVTGGEATLHVRRKDDTLVLVPLGKIRAGRVVEEPRKR